MPHGDVFMHFARTHAFFLFKRIRQSICFMQIYIEETPLGLWMQFMHEETIKNRSLSHSFLTYLGWNWQKREKDKFLYQKKIFLLLLLLLGINAKLLIYRNFSLGDSFIKTLRQGIYAWWDIFCDKIIDLQD